MRQGAPPCAPTPLSHAVGEGLGVRANKRALPAYRTQAMYPCQGGSRGERLFALACFVEGVETGWEQQGAPLSTTCALGGVEPLRTAKHGIITAKFNGEASWHAEFG